MDKMDSSPDLRVLFVNRMAALERGGGETFDLGISAALAQKGVRISFLTGAPLLRRAPCAMPDFIEAVHYLHTPWLHWFPWDKVKGGWRIHYLEFLYFEWRAFRWIMRHQDDFDVVQICELPNLVDWLKQAGCRLPLSLRLTAPNYYDPRGGIARADLLIASGTSIATLHQRGLTRVQDVPNAVNHAAFHPGRSAAWRAQHGFTQTQPLSLYVARFQAFKNHPFLLEAFARVHAQMPETRLVLAGRGPLQARIRSQAAAMGLSDAILFLGDVPHDQLPDVYRAADLKVISSDYESFCFAAIEAMASGLPVLTTDCGWVPRLVETCGVVSPLQDVDAFAAAWLRLLKNPAERETLGTAGREKAVREHGWASSAEKLFTLYQGLPIPPRG